MHGGWRRRELWGSPGSPGCPYPIQAPACHRHKATSKDDGRQQGSKNMFRFKDAWKKCWEDDMSDMCYSSFWWNMFFFQEGRLI